jgi:hypothetical protein
LTDAEQAALRSLCAVTRWCFGAAAVSIAVVDDDGLSYVAADGVTGDAIVGTRLRSGHGIAGFVAATGQSITVHDLEHDPRFARDVAERVGYVPTSMQCVPFHDDAGDVAGVISLLDRSDHPLGAADSPSIEWVTALAAQLCRDGVDQRSIDSRLDGLSGPDRERATEVISAVIDAFRR